MSRNTKIVVVTMAVLSLAVVALAWLNRNNVAERKALQENGTFLVTVGDSRYTVTMSGIEGIGSRVIDANYKTNLMPAVQKKYTGVSLKSVLDSLGADYSTAKSVRFSAMDGYVSVAAVSDALNEDNCFIVFEEAGKPLGTREAGGVGPFMVIFAKDRFSLRWCKYLLEITVS